mmetsp:Transcript_13333/g.33953  ORF Transcript_13333/g.33953 Transcript_13333/m.33953 type:complete len:274 (+) Transcript_13333:286-1107(+)
MLLLRPSRALRHPRKAHTREHKAPRPSPRAPSQPAAAAPRARQAPAWSAGAQALSRSFLRLPSFFFSLFSRLESPRIVFALSSSRLKGRSSSSSSESSSESYASSVVVGGWIDMVFWPAGSCGPWPRMLVTVGSGLPCASTAPSRACACVDAYSCRISLVRCSMMPRYCIMLLSVTPSLPSISMLAGVLQPILLKMLWMPTLSAFTVFIAASYFFSYCSALASVFCSRSSRSLRIFFRWLSVFSPCPLYFSISDLMSAICSSSFSHSEFSSLT